MKYCPHCRKPTLMTAGACPHCGKDLAGVVATAAPEVGYTAMSQGAEELDSELELDLGPPKVRPVGVPGGDLELDDGGPGRREPARPAAPSAPPTRPVALLAPPPPDPFEVDEVGGFGPKPSGLLATPAYALKVRKRTAALGAELERLARERDRAREDRQEALARLAERARSAGYSSPDVGPMLARVEAAEHQVAGARDLGAGERERHEARKAEIQTLLERLNARMQGPRAAEATLVGQLSVQEEQHIRTGAQLQQVEAAIQQLQAALAAAEQGTPPAPDAPDPAALRAKLPALQASREQLRVTLAQLAPPIAELRAELQDLRAELDRLAEERKAQVAAREAERRRHDEAMKQVASSTDEASRTVRDALAQVGEVIRLESPSEPWAKELYPSLDQRTERLSALVRQHGVHEAASRAFDQAAVRTGYTLLALGAGLVLVGGLGLIVLVAVLT